MINFKKWRVKNRVYIKEAVNFVFFVPIFLLCEIKLAIVIISAIMYLKRK